MITYEELVPDVTTYHELRASVNWSVFCTEQSTGALEHSIYGLVAKDGDDTVAMGRVVGDGMYYTIVDVIVKPAYQGQQIGSTIVNRLVDRVVAGIPEGGRACIQLIAAPGKEAFYEKLGFSSLPNDNAGPGFCKIIYV